MLTFHMAPIKTMPAIVVELVIRVRGFEKPIFRRHCFKRKISIDIIIVNVFRHQLWLHGQCLMVHRKETADIIVSINFVITIIMNQIRIHSACIHTRTFAIIKTLSFQTSFRLIYCLHSLALYSRTNFCTRTPSLVELNVPSDGISFSLFLFQEDVVPAYNDLFILPFNRNPTRF